MEPVQQVFSLRIQIQLDVAHVLAAVGEEIDLLVGLHTLRLKQLEQAAFGLFIVGLYPGKAPCRDLRFSLLIPLKGQEALAGNNLELSLLVLPADIPPSIPTVSGPSGAGTSSQLRWQPWTKQKCSSPNSSSNLSATSATCWRIVNVLTGSSIGSTSCKSLDVIP